MSSLTAGEIVISLFVFLMLGGGATVFIWYQVKRAQRRKNKKH